MNPTGTRPLPLLDVADFGPTLDHVAEAHQNGRIFAIVHTSDPVRPYLPLVQLDPNDPCVYVFVHGGQEFTRFENLRYGTHEIPSAVVAALLRAEYGTLLDGLCVRMCTCYGNMLRPGDTRTTVGNLARLLPATGFEAYHGFVKIDSTQPPLVIALGDSLAWNPVSGPYQVGPPGPWEPVAP